jgi:NADPH:quinone reductase-like Zn-dependent oxidoreductase
LVQVLCVALNPADYKPAEIPLMGRMIFPKPATLGIDFAGRIVTPAAGSSFKPGQLVFGVAGTSPLARAALREFAVTEEEGTLALPEVVGPVDAATIGVGGLTAYQTIVPRVKKGDKIFINGGSGGTGVFGIQSDDELLDRKCRTAQTSLP